jgi:hypothetical protein
VIVDPVGPGSAPRLAGGDRFSSTLVGQMNRQAGLLRTIADSQAQAEMDKYDAKELKLRTKMGQPIGERQPSTISQIGGALSGLAPVIGGLFGGGGSPSSLSDLARAAAGPTVFNPAGSNFQLPAWSF